MDTWIDFDIFVINIYLLTIFTNIIKNKTSSYMYRFLKLLILVLIGATIYTMIVTKVYWVEALVKGLPLIPIFVITVRTEIMLLLREIGFKGYTMFVNTIEDSVKIELIKSIDYLASKKIGALITFEKATSLDEYIATAFPIDAPLTHELLSTIFFPSTPLHDGAVIVRMNKIVCAGAYFPPTERLDIPKSLGSRHRAAIGISEVSDSLTIVVSEETGTISVAVNGYLDHSVSKESLLLYLEKHLQS